MALLALLFSLSGLISCSDTESVEDIVLYPDRPLAYLLYPNDRAQNDSAAANLAHGVELLVHPSAKYYLSFDADPSSEAPTLQLFRIVRGHYQQVRVLEPQVVGSRYVYSFVCEENDAAEWVTTLESGGTYYKGKVSNVLLEGEGGYSDHFSLNLIAVGDVEQNLDGFTLQKLADSLLTAFRHYYTSVYIDTIYLNRAHEHPTLGKKYPADLPWLAGYSSDDIMLSELGGWPGIENALDIVLVHFINDVDVLGYSDLFAGNLGSGTYSTLVLGSYVKMQDGSENVLPLSEIVETAVHETGHFFGLRHTTATTADLGRYVDGVNLGDYSNVEDGLDDTPYCSFLRSSGLLKSSSVPSSDIRQRLPQTLAAQGDAPKIGFGNCPDAGNVMFPMAVSDRKFTLSFSEQQLEIIRKNLMIFPH